MTVTSAPSLMKNELVSLFLSRGVKLVFVYTTGEFMRSSSTSLTFTRHCICSCPYFLPRGGGLVFTL